ncbi:MAG: RNA polymerase sigma-70 factor [Odoribacteraceae bacterium]|jgi:RNA polymerase sigma-70 factor (ECF subfamily)|nr:RNA polymerase sigma-70 factor [Odoribacteraceae bacterium]
MQEDITLFEQARAGDWNAFRRLFERDVEQLYLYAMGFVKNREDAEDIVQEVFITLWEKREKLSSVEIPRAYLFRSVRNACIDRLLHARVKQKYREEVIALHRGSGSENDDPETLFLRLHAALGTLPPRCREIFTLGCIDGMSYKEIADATGTSVNTVKSQIKIAYKKLREEMGDEEALSLLLLLSALLSRPS